MTRCRSVFLGLLLLFFSISAIGQTYNATNFTATNKSLGIAQAVSTDARSWMFDSTAMHRVMRDYNGTSEVFSYLNLATFRSGHFPVFVHSGGILQSNGVWLGGSTLVYWFKDSTGNANLVRWYTDSTGTPGGPFYAVANNLSEGNAGLIKGNLALDLVNNTSDAQKNAASVSLTNHTIDANNNTLLHIPNSALTNTSIGLTLNNTGATPQVTTTPAALGTSLVLSVSYTDGSDSGFLKGTDWTFFHGKLDSVRVSNDSVYNCVNGTCTLQSVIAGGGAVNSVNGTNASLLFSPTTGNVLGQVNPAYAFNWTGQHTYLTAAPIFSTLTTNGGLFYGNGSGQLLQSGAGTSAQILQSNGGTAPTFFSPGPSTVNGWLGYTALSNALGSTHLFVGNGSNVATDVALGGDATLANTGAMTIANNAITTVKINNNAVTYAKIQAASGQSLLGATGASNFQEISLGTNLSITGTTLNAAGGFVDPLTTNGDIIARISGSTTRLAQGGNGTFLGVSGGLLGYYTPSGAIGGSIAAPQVAFGSGSNTIAGNASLTWDNTAKKLSADSVSSHTDRSDTLVLNRMSFWPYPDSLQGFGHSIIDGLNANPHYYYFTGRTPFVDSSFRSLFASFLNVPDFNHGYAGSGSVDAAMIAFYFQSLGSRATTLLLSARNNILNVAPTNPNTYNKIINADKVLWVNANLKRFKAAGMTDSVITYGTWIAYAPTGTSALFKYINIPLSETKTSTLARQTSTINDSIVWTSPVDTTVVIELLGWKLAGSIVQVYIDNVSQGTWNTNFQNDSSNTDIFLTPGRGPFPLIFTGLTNASHKVKIVNTTTGKLVVDFFGNLRDAKYAYPFIIMHDIDYGGTATNITLNNGKLDSLVAKLPAGYPVVTFPTNTYYNNSIGLSGDLIHPNNIGHWEIDSGLVAFYSPRIPFGQVGTMNFANAPYFREGTGITGVRRMVTSYDISNQYLPNNFTNKQVVQMNNYTLTFWDSASGHYIYAPNLSLADSSANTYLTLNCFHTNTSNNGIRTFSTSSANTNPSFMIVGGNSSTYGGQTSANTGAAALFDYRSVTAPFRLAVKANGSGSDVIPFGIHESGGMDIGGVDNTDSTDTWVYIKAGTAARSQIKLAPSPASNHSKNGQLQYTVVGGQPDSLNFTHNGVTTNLLAFSQATLASLAYTAVGATQAVNTSAETSIAGTGPGSLTIAANALTIGKTYRFKISGIYNTTTVPGNVTFKLKIGSVTIGTGTVNNLVTMASGLAWSCTGTFVCWTTGSSGTVITDALLKYSQGNLLAADNLEMDNSGVVSTINTTTSNLVDFTVQWVTADPSNAWKANVFTLESLN